MSSTNFILQPHSHRNRDFLRTLSARAIWSRFACPRAELIGSPSLSRPSLFAGD